MKPTAWFVCLVLIGAFTCACPDTASAGEARPGSREYKLLLKTERFADRHRGVKEFWKLVKEVAREENVKVSEEPDFLDAEATRYVAFLDVKSFDVYKKSFIIRRRQEEKLKDHGKAEFELMLKFRSPDAQASFAQNVDPGSGYEGKVKFEEDVIGTGSGVRHVFSHSGKVELEEHWMQEFGDYIQVFPSLGKLGIAAGTKMAIVNDVTIKERTFEPGELAFSVGPKASAAFAVWYRKGEDAPLIAEFSFKCSLKTPQDARAGDAGSFLEALQKRVKDWVAIGQTKTGTVYKLTNPDQD